MGLSRCITSVLHACGRRWAPGCARPPEVRAEELAVVYPVLEKIANASRLGLPPGEEVQKIHDLLLDAQCGETRKPLSSNRLARSLQSLENQYTAQRDVLQRQSNEWARAWLSGTEPSSAQHFSTVHRRFELAKEVIGDIRSARQDLDSVKPRPRSC